MVCGDLGHGLPFRNGLFDGCISISAVQWLCHATRPEHDPPRRVAKFFSALRAVLAAGARAVLQLYPEQPEHMAMLRDAALAAGFGGGLIVDFPWSERSKKLFLVLIAPTRNALPPKQSGAGHQGSGAAATSSRTNSERRGHEGGGKKRNAAAADVWEAALAPKRARGKNKKQKRVGGA